MKVWFVVVTLQYPWQLATGEVSSFTDLFSADTAEGAVALATALSQGAAGSVREVTATEATAAQFLAYLDKLDWYYAYSDDHRVYQRGVASFDKAAALANAGGSEFASLFAQYSDYMFNGKGAKPAVA